MLHSKEQSGVCGCVKSRVPVSSSDYQTGLQLVVSSLHLESGTKRQWGGSKVRGQASISSAADLLPYGHVRHGSTTPLVSPLFGINHGDQYDQLTTLRLILKQCVVVKRAEWRGVDNCVESIVLSICLCIYV